MTCIVTCNARRVRQYVNNVRNGGYGNPLERPVDLVIADVENRYVSTVAAKKQYGVGDTNVDDRKQPSGGVDC
jgi:N-methylhydantoinase B/oxoprolinase/acetone carboxylase alpha subunit